MATFIGSSSHDPPLNTSGSASNAPPVAPAKRPAMAPRRMVVSNERSPANKLSAPNRIQTPSARRIRKRQPQNQVHPVFQRPLFAKQQRLEFHPAYKPRRNGRGHAKLHQQIDKDEAVFHGSRHRCEQVLFENVAPFLLKARHELRLF
jgi:hypothetical protein